MSDERSDYLTESTSESPNLDLADADKTGVAETAATGTEGFTMTILADKLAGYYKLDAAVLTELHAACMLDAEQDESATLVKLTERLTLPTGTYAKAGGTAKFVIRKDESGATNIVYVDRNGAPREMTGRQAEHQWTKLGFSVRNGDQMPLIRRQKNGTSTRTVKNAAEPMTDERRAYLLNLANG